MLKTQMPGIPILDPNKPRRVATKRPTFSVGFLARCDNAAKIRESNRRTLGMRWRNGIGILDGRCNIVFEKGRRGLEFKATRR